MMPIEAFDWLLERFRRYSRNQLTWRDARQMLGEAETLKEHYRQFVTRDIDEAQIEKFVLNLRATLATSRLGDCTDDYLWRRIHQRAKRGEALEVACTAMVLWLRAGD